jgi:hypothetical protein
MDHGEAVAAGGVVEHQALEGDHVWAPAAGLQEAGLLLQLGGILDGDRLAGGTVARLDDDAEAALAEAGHLLVLIRVCDAGTDPLAGRL